MLKSLYVKNFVIIDEIALDFNDGFSAFTGETGAGKSLIIDAIGYLIGQRGESGLIKAGATNCIIEGVFDISDDSYCKDLLDDAMLEYDDEISVSRIINENGKSQIKINNRPFTLSFLKTLLNHQIDIHSQHDNQYLMNKQNHIKLLDQYINDPSLFDEIASSYKQYRSLKNEYQQLANASDDNFDIDYINYQISEIENANLVVGEDIELEILDKKYRNSAKIIKACNEALNLYDSDDGIHDSMYELSKTLNVDDDALNNLNERINNSFAELEDIIESIRDYQANLDVDEEVINEVSKRIYTINQLKRKYGSTIDNILDKYNQLLQQQQFLENKQAYLAKLQIEIDQAYAIYNKHAIKLSEMRIKGAKALEISVLSNLSQLMLENANFQIEIVKAQDSAIGFDDVSFLVAMNKNMSVRPLNKVASGGELSRMMLGLKCIFTQLMDIKTIIFDEIDTGVSGPVATSIGLKMAQLAKESQVFAVTHLAQVAACATSHYHVYKSNDDAIHTDIELLQGQRRVDEIALLASASDSSAAKDAAFELLVKMQEKINE